jgi:hypothetical protein
LREFDEEEADHIIKRYTTINPQRGEEMIAGDLHERSSMKFTRQQLRDSIHRVDHEGVGNRSDFLKKKIVR